MRVCGFVQDRTVIDDDIHTQDNSEINNSTDSNLDNEPRLGLLHPVIDDARTIRIEPFKCPDGLAEVALLEVILRSCKPREQMPTTS